MDSQETNGAVFNQQMKILAIFISVVVVAAGLFGFGLYYSLMRGGTPTVAESAQKQSGFTDAAGHIYEGVQIYNKNGQLAGTVTDPATKWNGAEAVEIRKPDGTQSWIARESIRNSLWQVRKDDPKI